MTGGPGPRGEAGDREAASGAGAKAVGGPGSPVGAGNGDPARSEKDDVARHEPHGGRAHSHDELRLACGAAEPVVFAGRADLTVADAADAAGLQRHVGGVLAELCRLLREAGCTLVGHIKGSLDGGDGAIRQFSVTALDGRVSFRGDWRSEAEPTSLTLNAIVFGVGEAAVAAAAAGSLTAWAGVEAQWR